MSVVIRALSCASWFAGPEKLAGSSGEQHVGFCSCGASTAQGTRDAARCGRRGAKGTFETEADKWKLSPGRLARPPASVPVSPEGAKQQRVVFTSLGRQAEYTAVRPASKRRPPSSQRAESPT